MVEYAYKENGVMKLKPVALSLSQSEIDEIATELLEAMQPDWQNAISISTSQIPYTVPADGFFVAQMADSSTSGSDQDVYINDKYVGGILSKINAAGFIFWREINFTIPVSKGDIIKITNKDSGTTFVGGYASFVPFKTSNPVSLRPLDPHKIDTAILNHWDDITSDFSTAGSSNVALDNAKYNPILRKLRIKCHNTTSQASGSGRSFVITYNGSDLPAFTDSCIYTGSKIQTSDVAGFEFSSWIKQANQVSFYIYNRTSSAWPANTYTNIQVEF